jgi:carboxypeptidase family protein
VFSVVNTDEVEKMRRTLVFLTIFLLALMAVRGVSAAPQSRGSSTLSGIVLGPDDRPVANASVSYQVSSGSAPHVVRTDAHGHFTISKLKADNYDLRASGKGVFSEWQKNITLRSGATKELTVHLIYAKQIPKAYVKSKPTQ